MLSKMNNIKIHVRDDISYVRKSEMSDEDKELFLLFNLAAARPYFPDESPTTYYANDFERYLERKESYVIKYGGLSEFKKSLSKHHGYVPYV